MLDTLSESDGSLSLIVDTVTVYHWIRFKKKSLYIEDIEGM